MGRPDLLVLAHLRSGHTYAQPAAGFGVGTYQYIAEAIDVLATLAPALPDAMKTASTKAFVILQASAAACCSLFSSDSAADRTAASDSVYARHSSRVPEKIGGLTNRSGSGG